MSAETLERSGVADIRDLNQVAPSLLVCSTGDEANGSARIRGIGTVGDNPGLESSVAVFVDGVYRSRSGSRLVQTSENFAVFTHNIFHITDRLDLTLGLRYTNETKETLSTRSASAVLVVATSCASAAAGMQTSAPLSRG